MIIIFPNKNKKTKEIRLKNRTTVLKKYRKKISKIYKTLKKTKF